MEYRKDKDDIFDDVYPRVLFIVYTTLASMHIISVYKADSFTNLYTFQRSFNDSDQRSE